MIESNPGKLVDRYTFELANMSTTNSHFPDGAVRAVVEYGNALRLLERAIREAWVQGAIYGQAIASSPMVIHVEEQAPRVVPVPVYPEGPMRK